MLGYCNDIILPPKVKSDVATTDVYRESREWHPKAKFITDILKVNDKTKFIGEGHKVNHKSLIADILRENAKTQLIEGKGGPYTPLPDDDPKPNPDTDPFNPDDDDGPCMEYYKAHADCLLSNGMTDEEVYPCFMCAWNAWKDIEWILCLALKEEGFCDEVLTCWDEYCNNVCSDEGIDAVGCMLHYDGCDKNQFEIECISGS